MTFLIKIETSKESCLCDFTFDFYWQHKGSRLNPDQKVDGVSYRELVDALKMGESIHIHGQAGDRLGSSLGVDLMKFGGKGGPLDNVGKIIVDGNVGKRMGISMLRGAIYVSGKTETPLGNVVEVETDLTGYRKFISITEVLERGGLVLAPNTLTPDTLLLKDGVIRETLAARNTSDRELRIKGNAGMSTGILMRSGSLKIDGNAGRNTGVLMKGGRIIVKRSTDDFTGAEMQGGEIIVQESAGGYMCAKMRGGEIFAKEGKPIPPARPLQLNQTEIQLVSKALNLNTIHAMMYKKFKA